MYLNDISSVIITFKPIMFTDYAVSLTHKSMSENGEKRLDYEQY